MEKEFDAVKEMHSIREKLQKEYEINPALRLNTVWLSRSLFYLISRLNEIDSQTAFTKLS